MTVVEIREGDGPVILGQPHGGTHVPEDIFARLNETGQALADTDWHIGRLYDGLLPGATVVASTVHRYVIDANRDPAGLSLYPGQNTTGLCPVTDFDGRSIWEDDKSPTDADILERISAYHAPYHAALSEQIERVRARHGFAILYDCHSIRSRIPFLFPGTLPDFNIGTNEGATCAPEIETVAADICGAAEGFSTIRNGRFKGGWTTRRYGRPENGVHAIQMELAQATYMEEAPPWRFDDAKASRLRPVLKDILETLNRWRPA